MWGEYIEWWCRATVLSVCQVRVRGRLCATARWVGACGRVESVVAVVVPVANVDSARGRDAAPADN
jgi:hypothetical protein